MYQRKEMKEKNFNTVVVSDRMKQDFEEQRRFYYKDVKVHYNSDKPEHSQILAGTQRSQFYVEPGQERNLDHELGHVVQQKQRQVRVAASAEDLAGNENKSLQSSDTIQMAQATIKEIEDEDAEGHGNERRTKGPVVNHEPYPHHAEQGVWNKCSRHLINKLKDHHRENITFLVDTSICPDCRAWFENTVWKELHDTGGDFRLFVEVDGNTVEITGTDNTIWPNEITDSPTWDRLGKYDEMHRFVTEQRNPAEGQNYGALTNHIYLGQQQEAAIDEQMQYYGNDEGFKTLVEESLVKAKNNIVRRFFLMYDFADETAMHKEMEYITLLTVMNEAPTLMIPDIGEYNMDWGKWELQLTEAFEWWLENWIDSNFEEHRVQKDNSHWH